MNEYSVETRGTQRTMVCRGETIEAAAQHAATRVAGRTAIAHRTTGSPGLSGWFQSYKPDKRAGGLNSTGPAFHIVQD